MKTYFAVVDKEPGTAHGMWFPDVPGCFSAAEKSNELIANAIEALTLHSDGETLPEPRSIDELLTDEDVSEALERGSYLLAIPFIELFNRSVRKNISMDAGMVKAINAQAQQRGQNFSQYLAELAKRDIEGKLAG